MSQYVTVLDDEHPVIFIDGEPLTNLTKAKRSWKLQKIIKKDVFVQDGKTYVQYTVEQ